MIGPRIKGQLERLGEPVFRSFDRLGISPNALTLIGLGINLLAALLLFQGNFTVGGIGILAAGLFDMLDGGVARVRGGGDSFGAFLDSMVDRCSDFLLLTGILLYYAKIGQIALAGLCSFAILGTVLIPYARARAERFLPECKVGWMERPERILLLAAGSIINLVPVTLAVLALLNHITVFQRIYFCRKHLSRPESSTVRVGVIDRE
jgi:CDP-diacylglycerol--glycerol-3-phosphate 3-phosphatidyltransferase